ncbi:deoxynucleotide monophosphate kinase family protein [Kitasatospora sp. NPDC001095]
MALIGKAQSGKDTIGARLGTQYSFVRVAFADPLRSVALDLDPIVGAESTLYGHLPIRLSDLVGRHGWETAKTRFPEVRRTLQRLGEAVRTHDPDYWVRLALERVDVADQWNVPVVVTDVRHVNELDALRARGALVVRVVRPGVGRLAGAEGEHVTETELDQVEADVTITNVGTVEDLHRLADSLAVRRS